ncbi:UvrD-helicase domain-containing protein [Hydromonas duriensis]|uniref:DNA helicase-2/ATP-dependent DNA helicase PcrA n=1 Tax=Hydromonas duriensis TaxID=1527608 RepID=A0A4R6Y4W2_9BURK|nr:UvrD-helicase domain-containing protein [Hydromonas duriensis]TDR28994.1 DNA helicase-2/ATP-dependent DNA helicase PcrA [Hydromonas duriensis]
MFGMITHPDGDVVVNSDYFEGKTIQYKEYLLIREGLISHDEVIAVAYEMFKKFPKLCLILKSAYPFILVDEYQDTSKNVIEILLDFLPQQEQIKCVVGLFGDAMQSIYDDGVGDVKGYVSSGNLVEIQKKQNRRNPRLVFELANKLRTDGITQVSSTDKSAPNMLNDCVKEGVIQFYYSNGKQQLESLKTQLGWDFTDTQNVKILNLTHNLIAEKAGFSELMAIYDKDRILEYKNNIKKFIKDKELKISNFSSMTFGEVIDKLKELNPAHLNELEPKRVQAEFMVTYPHLLVFAKSLNFELFQKIYLDKDSLIDNGTSSQSKQDDLIRHLHKLQRNISLYETKQFNEFLRVTEYKIKKMENKIELEDSIKALATMSDNTIEEVIEFADQKNICIKDDRLNNFIAKFPYIYERVKTVKYQEFRNLYQYLSGSTPYSTQHKVKGTEYSKVLVILDNGGWNNYNFNCLFCSQGCKDTVVNRTLKLFYVCCTRAKEELVVYFHEPKNEVISEARLWFGNTTEITAQTS